MVVAKFKGGKMNTVPNLSFDIQATIEELEESMQRVEKAIGQALANDALLAHEGKEYAASLLDIFAGVRRRSAHLYEAEADNKKRSEALA